MILLDRDGVINEDSPDYIKTPEEWRPVPGALEAIARVSQCGLPIAVCTNQAGIARGRVSQSNLCAIHARMTRDIRALQGNLGLIRYCPHHPDQGCSCRKPAPDMLTQCCAWFGIPAMDTWFVGDSLKDLHAAERAGCLPVLVRTGNGRQTESQIDPENYWVFDNLPSALEAAV